MIFITMEFPLILRNMIIYESMIYRRVDWYHSLYKEYYVPVKEVKEE